MSKLLSGWLAPHMKRTRVKSHMSLACQPECHTVYMTHVTYVTCSRRCTCRVSWTAALRSNFGLGALESSGISFAGALEAPRHNSSGMANAATGGQGRGPACREGQGLGPSLCTGGAEQALRLLTHLQSREGRLRADAFAPTTITHNHYPHHTTPTHTPFIPGHS